ncbi:ankyrin repeat and MYND domain-containing protein 1 isoform X4 [Rousettus aegyptiacus]|uniref:ankyrin repeat and MYND domain-containing protein 1 isoform X4 n=1 Tax=Rousettus aegyptiacus TaxID=9407 RepID=UPI00168D3816|nr:ankyrin repeat and MYND domain-containing protein 1 isoform X4 [Rousettus aegyptiacus]
MAAQTAQFVSAQFPKPQLEGAGQRLDLRARCPVETSESRRTAEAVAPGRPGAVGASSPGLSATPRQGCRRDPDGDAPSCGSKTRDMESGRSSLSHYEVPDGDQLEARGSEPAASEAPGTPESSRLFKRDAPEAPEEQEELQEERQEEQQEEQQEQEQEEQQEEQQEEHESEGPQREPDLKEAYVQLVQGVQEWQDGCVYRGQFGLDMKLGYGEFSWPTGESYRGQFYRDHRHGVGTYVWPDGSSFTGMFYLSHREGYGTMYMKATLFQKGRPDRPGPWDSVGHTSLATHLHAVPEPGPYRTPGLYKADERFGPGVETYPDGSQDVGLWFRRDLVRLCMDIPGSFSVRSYPEFAGFLGHPAARISLADDETMRWDLHEERDPFFYDYKRFLLDDSLTSPPGMYIYSTDSTHLPMTRSLREDLDAWVFQQDIPPFVEDGDPWFIKNETPLLVKIQKQAYKFRNKKAHASWKMGAILEGSRRGFGSRGPKERLSRELILKAKEGNYDWVRGVLRDNLASPNVADARGYSVLAAAAVHCHTSIVNLLLDSGADVNQCTDEGLTPLSMCFLLHYPASAFKLNLAERTAPPPQEGPKLSGTRTRFLSFYKSDSIFFELARARGSQDLRPLPTAASSQESVNPRASLQKPTSPRGSVRGPDEAEQGPDDVPGNVDRCTQCSDETNFESDMSVCSFAFVLSRDILEKSAKNHSMLQGPRFGDPGSDKGTMRQMALSMIESRNRWLTINLLLHRGADPNLCHVPMQALFFAVKAGDVDGVKLLLEKGARTDIQLPPERGSLTPLHIAAALPGEAGVKITELLLHAVTDVDARAADQDDVHRLGKLDMLPSSLKLNNEAGPPKIYYSEHTSVPREGGRTALHVACEREDNYKCARDVVRLLLSHRADTSLLWSGHSPLSLSIVSGNDLIVKELLSHGANPNLLLTKGLGSALCVACDLAYEHHRSTDSKLALIDRLISYGADILNPVTLTQGDKVAVGTAVDYGYFRFFQDRKIAHCPFHTLTPAERETFLARKRLLDYMGVQLRRAVLARESQWDPKLLCLSKRVELTPYHRLKRRSPGSKGSHPEEQELIPFFKFCYQCGRSVGVRLAPCARCYGMLACSKNCKTKAWADFHKRDCSALASIGS